MQAGPTFIQHDEITVLLRGLGRFRWRLGLERSLQFAARGAIGSGLILIALSATDWLADSNAIGSLAWLTIVPLLGALCVAVLRWPSRRHAALAADRRLALDDRLTTAVELLDRRSSGRFDRLQIRDAAQHATARANVLLALDTRSRNEGLLAACVLVLGAASLLLPLVPRPLAPTPDRTSTLTDLAGLPDTADRALSEDSLDLALASAQPVPQAQADADLATRVQQEQNERAALDALARALSSVSAGQAAADAIEQGNFEAARDQLQNLGEEADQLSDAAKQQLGRALQQAAATTAQADRQLSDRERQAAQALARPSYSDQRQALRALADQVERSGSRSVPRDQLERDLGRLQQQSGDVAAQSSGAGGQTPSSAPPTRSDAGGNLGQPGAPGVGTEPDPNLFAADSSRLDTSGQRVVVPTRLGNGPGVRPADGTEDQLGADPSVGTRSVSELTQAQQTGQVAPEQNLVPGEQRPVVRGYFR